MLRICLLCFTALLVAFLFFSDYIILSVLILLLLVAQTVSLINYTNHTNRKIAYFFDAIKNEDFTLRFPEKLSLKSLEELNHSLNMLNTMIQDIHIKKQIQEQYYQEIIRQSDIGIMTINKKGHILFANKKIEELLSYRPLNHIKQLNQVDPDLYELFSKLMPFERKLVQLSNEREKKQLALKSTALALNKEELLLVVAQDIHQELDEKETDSWVRLIRVLTHEIMNTITPITSISESILKYYKSENEPISLQDFNKDHIKNTVRGLEVIKEQGGDLMLFVESYRSFLNLPPPDKTLVPAQKIMNKVKVLLEQESKNGRITIETIINPEEIELFIDEKQISQVLVNLGKNAAQSLGEQENGLIKITTATNSKGVKYIEVWDNGPGISPELIDEIFVPFFTTKKSGTGIGLSLSRQIMHLHGGNLIVHSVQPEYTSFVLSF
ncbi:ATP-binding protein [uncultured Eudoraea sp.]|uniref:sensor histidine kinase n=1 Tax=uncultured Eudoraea sp. TaxID=1035614 RepID=UPI00262974E9|nr:ATP-binding protein [uncultured Eudoraea sp.]